MSAARDVYARRRRDASTDCSTIVCCCTAAPAPPRSSHSPNCSPTAGRHGSSPPTHPGFGGATRPNWLSTVTGLAEVYLHVLNHLDLRDVTIVGFSNGGWIAAELALRGSDRISSTILVDAVGIQVQDHPVADVFALSIDELSQLSYHDPAKFRASLTTPSEAQQTAAAANRTALGVYGAGPAMADPTLRDRLSAITVPTLVLWGRGRPGRRSRLQPRLRRRHPRRPLPPTHPNRPPPQIETPDQLLDQVWAFLDTPLPSQSRC